MPRIDSAKTIQQKQILWDEIEAINKKGLEKLIERSGLLDYLDPENETHLKIVEQLLNISEEEAKRRFTLSDKTKDLLSNIKISKEALQEMKRIQQEKEDEQKQITEVISEIREQGSTIREMNLGLTTTRKLLKAVKKYGSIEEAILIYREAILSKGHKGIEPEMIPVIEVYGSLKDLSMLICLGYIQGVGYDAPSISEKQSIQIRNVLTSSAKGYEFFRTYISAYSALNISQWVSLYFKKSYEYHLTLTAEAIIKWKIAKKLQTIYEVVTRDFRDKELEDITKLMGDTTPPISELWENVTDCAKTANKALGEFKGAIEFCKEWLSSIDAKEFFPYPYGQQLESIKNTEAYSNIPYNYYVSSLTSSEVPEGATEPDGEEGTALLMTYDEIDPLTYGKDNMAYALKSEFNERYKHRKK